MNPVDLAKAYLKVAKINHYLVGVSPGYTADDLDAAEQVLIGWENETGTSEALDLAFDCLRADRRALSKKLTFAEFSAANRARCESPQGFKHPLNGWTTSDWMTALVGEIGEAANVVKKLNRYRDGMPGNKQSPEDLQASLRRELGDVFCYLDLIAQSLGFHIADAAVEVFNAKSDEIDYPEKIIAP